MRVMPAAPSREPSARRAWSIRPVRPSWASRDGIRSLAGRTWPGHRLFIIVAIPAFLLRVDAELGYRWQAWFNDSFEYLQNTVHFNLDPIRASGYSVWLKILQPLHSYAVVTILQHLMGLAVAVMVYALARHRFGARPCAGHAGRRPRALRRVRDPARAPDHGRHPAAVPARAGDHDAAVEPGGPVAAHVPAGRPAARPRRLRPGGRPAAARGLRRLHDHQAGQLAEGRGHHRGVHDPGGRLRRRVRPGARPARDERCHRRVPVLPGDDVRRVRQDERPRRRALALHHVPPDQRPIAQAYIWTVAVPAGPLPAGQVRPGSRTSWRRTSPSAPSRPSRSTTPRPWSTTPGGRSAGAGGVPQRRDLRRVPVRQPLTADSDLGRRPASGPTTPSRPPTCRATRSPMSSRPSPPSCGCTSGTSTCRAPCTGSSCWSAWAASCWPGGGWAARRCCRGPSRWR